MFIDEDYLAFGYWLQMTEEVDGTITYGVDTFYGGPTEYDPASMKNVMGSATYNGKATGMYAMKDVTTSPVEPVAAGQFTADAKLEANFGGDDVAVNDQFTISGTVNNFHDADTGDMISGGAWTVDLRKTPSGSGNFQNTNAFSGDTTGGGSYAGTFYGPDGPDTNNPNNPAQPTGVAGEFNAHVGNGHVIGAFGATR